MERAISADEMLQEFAVAHRLLPAGELLVSLCTYGKEGGEEILLFGKWCEKTRINLELYEIYNGDKPLWKCVYQREGKESRTRFIGRCEYNDEARKHAKSLEQGLSSRLVKEVAVNG